MDEIKVRLTQQASMFSERCGFSRYTTLPSDEQFLELLSLKDSPRSGEDFVEQWRARTEPRFFSSFNSRAETLADFRRLWPDAATEIIDSAKRISEGRFRLLGLPELNLGEIDWHVEPSSGKRTPLRHWSRLDYLDATVAGDKKITWELNRHQYFTTLGRAYWLTDDEQYARVFVAHINSWMDQNPPKLGINWASSLEIAFRSISWLWALEFFKHSPTIASSVVLRLVKCLYLNASHLETYLSTYFSPNTHLTGEALGLFYIGLMLPELRDAERWRNLGLHILTAQLGRHVKPDGVYFEQSSYYHRYTADFYTHLTILLRANGIALPEQLEPNLTLLLDHLMYITRPDGTTPFFGDDDGGRLVMLDNRPANDFRAVLSTGCALFDRSDYKFVAETLAEETLWLLGPPGVRTFENIEAQRPIKESIEFENGGYYVMRDGWSKSSNYLLFDCGPHGTDNCGHAHADALSIDVAARGRTMLADPGTFTYTASTELRDWFRSSAAHNTLTVDGESSSIPAGAFSWKTIADCARLQWIDGRRFNYVSGRHAGYERLAKPGVHTRSILFLKGDYWIIRDQIELTGVHQVDLWFHFAPGTYPVINSTGSVPWVTEKQGKAGLKLLSFGQGGSWKAERGWLSPCYGHKVPAPVCVFSAPFEGAFEIITFLFPQEPNESEHIVNPIDVSVGRGFEVSNKEHRDLLFIADGKVAKTSFGSSNFDYTWLRFHLAEPTPEEGVAVGGQLLEINGRRIVDSQQRSSYWLKRHGDSLKPVS
ncbi:MAG TPA: alginate lyase family protein [Pyrinomonadaceae bacterium]